MSISDKEYNKISDTVYWIDIKHKDYNPDITEGSVQKIAGQSYKVLKLKDSKENGKVDTSQVVIAYAGTNVGDDLDVLTDVQTVGLKKDTLTASTRVEVPFNPNKPSDRYVTTTTIVEAQSVTALQFANEISKLYPNSRITTTGHSLGEYLALLVAAENQWVNVGFNGPDPYGVLSKEAKEWVKRNPGWLTNFRNRGDAIGNINFTGTGAETMISFDMGFNPFKGAFYSLSTWEFDDEGRLLIPKNEYNKKALQQEIERQLVQEFILKMALLSDLKAKFQAKTLEKKLRRQNK